MTFFLLDFLPLVKGNKEIRQEIPECNNTNGKEFCQVKIDLELAHNKP